MSFIFGSVPKAGEPLQPREHPDNVKAKDEALLQRIERMKAKLSTKGGWFSQYARTLRRFNTAWRKLYRSPYNRLCERRDALRGDYEALLHEFKQANDAQRRASLATRGRAMAAAGREIIAQIAPFQPLFDEWDALRVRLEAHLKAEKQERKEAEDHRAFFGECRRWEEQIKAVFRNTANLNHKGEDKNGNSFTHIPQIEHIFFREHEVLYKIKTAKQNILQRIGGRWSSALPYNVIPPNLVHPDTLAALSATCDRPITIKYGEAGQGLFYAISRPDAHSGVPDNVPYPRVVEYYPEERHARTPFPAGVSENQTLEWLDFESTPHWLVAGMTLSGKSNFVNQIIATLVKMNTPRELRIILIDNKAGIEFSHWDGIHHALLPMVEQVDMVLPTLQKLRSLMQMRMAMFRRLGGGGRGPKTLAQYNSIVADDAKLPRIVLFTDELVTLLDMKETKDIHSIFALIAAQGRAVGIHLVLATQQPTVNILPGRIKVNMFRISSRMPSFDASMSIVGSAAAADLPNIPGRMLFSIGIHDLICQTPFISNDDIAQAVKESQSFPKPDDSALAAILGSDIPPTETIIIPSPKLKFGLEQLIDLALSDFNGKLSAKRMNEKLGNEVISRRKLEQMVKELVEGDSEIEHRGQRYKIKPDRNSHVVVLATPQPTSQDDAGGDTDDSRGVEEIESVEEAA